MYAQLPEYFLVHMGQDHRRMCFAAPQLGKLLHGFIGNFVGGRTDRQGDQHLVGVEPRVLIAQAAGFQTLDWLDDGRGNQMEAGRTYYV